MLSDFSPVCTADADTVETAERTATILVVDDNWLACEIVRSALSSRGHKVLVAPSGNTGLETLSRWQVNLILLDLMLPDVDGAVLLDRIRRLPGLEGVPILAFSAFVSRLEELRRSEATFSGYIAKPVEPEHLIRIVEKYLAGPVSDEPPILHSI